jgi:hypothetical protein
MMMMVDQLVELRIKKFLRSVRRLLVAACVVPSSPIFRHPDEGGARFLRPSVLTRATRRNNPEDTILHSIGRENLKSYTVDKDFEEATGNIETEQYQ